MALVDYSSSDDEDAMVKSTLDATSLKRKRDDGGTDLPPLPSKFHDLYASTARVSTRDDPSMHGGRKRVTPHIEGNWPTHIYIEWCPSNTEHSSLTNLITNLKNHSSIQAPQPEIHSFLTSDLGAPLPLHISLSRPIGFLTDQKDAFSAALESSIRASGIRPFHVSLSGLDWVANFERTRWFLVLRLEKPTTDGLNKLLHVINTVVQENGQPPLYAKPSTPKKNERKGNRRRGQLEKAASRSDWDKIQDLSDAFHFSIAWMLTPPTEELVARTESLIASQLNEIHSVHIEIEEIKSKVGNHVISISLPRNQGESRALFEF